MRKCVATWTAGLIAAALFQFQGLAFGQTVAPPMPTSRPASRPTATAPALANTPIHFKVTGDDGKNMAGVKLQMAEGSTIFSPTLSDRVWHQELLTNDSGEAGAIHPNPRPITIIASKEGYASLLLRNIDPAKQDPVAISMTPGQTLTGTLKSPDAKPLAGTRISLIRQDYSLRDIPEFQLAGTTDTSGNFTVQHVLPGRYGLTVAVPGSQGAWAVPANDILVSKQSKPISLTAAASTTIKGKVVAPAGVDLQKLRISIRLRLPASANWDIPIAADGTFELSNIPANSTGLILLSLTDNNGSAGGFYPYVDVSKLPKGCLADENLQGVNFVEIAPGLYDGMTIEILKLANIKGTLSVEGGKPLPAVTGNNQLASIRAAPYSYGASIRSDTYSTFAPPREKGLSLEVNNSNLTGNSNWVRQSIPLPVLEPGQTFEQNITLRESPLPTTDQTISGTVVGSDGVIVPNAFVYLSNTGILPDPFRNRGEKHSWTGGSGYPAQTRSRPEGFDFDFIAAGVTDLWAYDPKLGWAVARNVKSGDREVQLKLIPQAEPLTISGKVLDPSNKPVASARVVLLFAGRQLPNQPLPPTVETKTDASGNFRLSPPPITTPASPTAGGQALDLVIVPSNPDTLGIAWKAIPRMTQSDLEFHLRPQATIRGHITDTHNQPIPDATLSVDAIQDASGGIGAVNSFSILPTPLEEFAPHAKTDAQGNYEFKGLPDGSTPMLAAQSNFHSRFGIFDIGEIHEGTQAPTLALESAVTFEGTVRAGDSLPPLANATVAVTSLNRAIQSTATDAQGHYRLTGVSRNAIQSGSDIALTAIAGPGDAALTGSITTRLEAPQRRHRSQHGYCRTGFNPSSARRLAKKHRPRFSARTFCHPAGRYRRSAHQSAGRKGHAHSFRLQPSAKVATLHAQRPRRQQGSHGRRPARSCPVALGILDQQRPALEDRGRWKNTY